MRPKTLRSRQASLRGFLLGGTCLALVFIASRSTSGTGGGPTLTATTTVARPGDNVVGYGIDYGNNGAYYTAFFKPGSGDTNPNDGGEALVGEFDAAFTSGAAPMWQLGWPAFAPGGYSCNTGGTISRDALVAVDVGPDGVYFAGSSDSLTVDSVGCKEGKEIAVKYNLNGSAGPSTAGAVWNATQRFYPGSNSYDGGEAFYTGRVSVEGGQTYFYAAGGAQSSGCNNTYAIRKYDANGNQVWQWQNSGGCGGEGINAISVDGSNVYAAGFSSYYGNVPQILRFSTSSGSGGPSTRFSGSLDGYAYGAYTSMVVYGGNIYAAGFLSNGEQQAYLLDEWNTTGTRLVHKVWSSDSTKSNGQQLMGIATVGSRLFVVGYTRNTDNPASAHNMGGNDVALFPNSATYHGYGDGVIFEVSPSDGSLISTTSYGTNDGNDQAFTGVTTDGTALYVIGAQRSGGVYQALVQRYSLGPTATTLTMPAAAATFGGTTTLQATLSSASGFVNEMPVAFSLFGTPVGSATTAGDGVATLNNVSLSGRNAGAYSGVVGASFAGTASYQTSSTTADLTITRAPASISVTGGGTFPYDGSAHSASGFVTGVFGESLGSASITYTDLGNESTSSTAPINAGSYRVNASFAGSTNYLDGSNSSITITITQARTSTTLQTWSWFDAAGGPYGLSGASTAEDASGHLMVWSGGPAHSTDLWVLSDANGLGGAPSWTKFTPSGPAGRHNAATAYDPSTNRLIIFGGCLGGCLPVSNDVWVLSYANGVGGTPAWTPLSPSGGPPAARQGMARGYDPTSNRLIIFGGQNGGSGGATYPDVWVLTSANGTGGASQWIRLSPDNTPPPGQYAPSSWYDAGTNRLVVAGGGAQGSGNPTNAVWALTNANGLGGTPHWINLIPEGAVGSPAGFSFWPAAYDPTDNRALLVEVGTPNVLLITDANGIGGAAAYQHVTLVAGPSDPSVVDSFNAGYDMAHHRLSLLSSPHTQLFVLGSADATGWTHPTVFGQPTTFTATVSPIAPGDGIPTGTVTFLDEGLTIATVPLNASGQAILTTSSLSVHLPAHSIAAFYHATTNYAGSPSPPLFHTVNRANTSTAVTSSTNPSVFYQTVTFTATVSTVAPGEGTPTGTVTFKDGGSTLGTGTLNASGQATFTYTYLSVGSHSITAAYNGDRSFNTSTSAALSQTTTQATTTTAVTSSRNPSVFGEWVTLTATVSSATSAAPLVPMVTFKDGDTTLGSASLGQSGPGSSQAILRTRSLSAGSHAITAVYPGDGCCFTGSTSSTFTQTVNRASTMTSVSSSQNSTAFGQPVTFTATVHAPYGGIATGTVQFKAGSATLGTGTLSSGQATFTTSSLSVGSHSITAAYWGDVNFDASTSLFIWQTVTNTTPVVNAGADQTSAEGVVVSLSGATFGDPDPGDAHQATVTWGDGTATQAATVNAGAVSGSHVYADNGAYTATVCVTDSYPATGCDTILVTVSNLAPIVNAGADRTVAEDAALGFSGAFTDAGAADTHVMTWDFGDGSAAVTGTLTPSHTYTRGDSYTVTLTVTDDDGAVGSDTLIVTVTPVNDPPVFDPIADQTVSLGAGAQSIQVTGVSPGPPDESGQTVVLSATSDNTSVVPHPTFGAGSPTLVGQMFFGGSGDQRAAGIFSDGSSLLVAGRSGINGLVQRYGPSLGSPTFSATVSGDVYFDGITVAGSTTFAVGAAVPPTCGASDGVGGTEPKSAVARYDGAGNLLGCQSTNFFNYRGGEWFTDAVTVETGGVPSVYVTGGAESCGFGHTLFVLAKYDQAGTLLQRVTEPGVSLGSGSCIGNSNGSGVASLNGFLYIVGQSNLTTEDGFRSFARPSLMKYDVAFNRVWKRRPMDYAAGVFNDVAAVGSHIYAVGYQYTPGVASSTNYLVEKYDEAGSRVWSRISGGASDDVLTGVVELGGRLFAVGYTRSSGAGGADAVILEIDPATGGTLSTTLFGGAQDDFANDVTAVGGELYVAAESRSFANGANPIGSNDVVLLRYRVDSGTTLTYSPSAPGTATVTVVAADGQSQNNTFSRTFTITVTNTAPIAHPGGPYVADLGSAVQLDGSASADPDAPAGDSIVSYSWQVGSFTLSGATPTLTGAQVNALGIGTHQVQLTVTDEFGATNTASARLSIYDNRPFASFTATPNPAACTQAIAFDGSASQAGRPDRAIVSYAWDFGDSSSASGQSVTHSYGRFGTFGATLTVTDNNTPAKTATATHTIVVNQGNQAPVANHGGPYVVDLGDGAVLNGTGSSDPNAACGDSIVSYAWTIDGGTLTLTGQSPGLTAAQISSLGVGTHPVSLTVTDEFGASNSASTVLAIYANVPTASFTANPNPAACSQAIAFDGSASQAGRPDRAIVSYAWNFGDGATGLSSTVTHGYGAFGTYVATLTVTDNNTPAKTATTTHTVVVNQGNLAPTANHGGPYTADLGSGVTLNGTGSSDPNAACGDSIVSYAWTIDGGTLTLTGQSPGLTAAQISSLGVGTHPVALTVTDEFGVSSSASTVLAIYTNVPTASFTANPNPAACSQAIAFDGSASQAGRPDRAIMSYAWNFGDGATGLSSTVTHEYDAFGTYVATLTVTDNNTPAKTATTTQTINVNQGNQPPVAQAGGPYDVDYGDSIQLNGGNSSDPNASCGDQIVSYSWTIDGTIHLSVATPTLDTAVNGLSVGSHNVSLTVTDTFGATNTASTTLNVVDSTPPVITADDVSAEATSAAGAIVSFSFSATDDFDPHPRVSADHASGETFPIGTTNVTVTATDAAGNWSTKTFHVNVVDTTKPTITLNAANPMTIEGGSRFTDPGMTASDTVDGDLTGEMVVSGTVNANVVGSYSLTYTVSDHSGNVQSALRTVNVVDTTPPVITLNGANPLIVEGGSTFTDPGATATDTVAGNLTAEIHVTGNVDTHVVGSYALTYSVSDGYNTTTATRTVNVVDTTKPTLTLPADITVDATSPAGAVVTYTASATDSVSGALAVTCAPPSGNTFAIGTSTVNCTAIDGAGNSAGGSFQVLVQAAAAQVSRLAVTVQSFNLAQGIENSLGTKLRNVLNVLNAAKNGSVVSVCNQMDAFINEAMAQSGNKLTAAQANQLIAAAWQIEAVIGCR